MKRLRGIIEGTGRMVATAIVTIGIAVLVISAILGPAAAQNMVRAAASSGNGGAFPLPTPYMLATHISATGTVCPKSSVGFVGGVVINTAGAAGSTIKIYNTGDSSHPLLAGTLLASVDATQTGHAFYYGMIANGGDGFCVVTASSGAAPDATVLWR